MPDWSKEVRAAIAGLNLEPTREQDVVDELGQHLRDRYEEMIASGIDAAQAYQTLVNELNDGSLVKVEMAINDGSQAFGVSCVMARAS